MQLEFSQNNKNMASSSFTYLQFPFHKTGDVRVGSFVIDVGGYETSFKCKYGLCNADKTTGWFGVTTI